MEPMFYKEESVPGKGMGCIAIKDIKKGSLVLRESPQLVLTDQMVADYDNLDHAVIESFLEMSKEQQERYLELHNNYDVACIEDSDNWSDGMKNDYKAVMPTLMTFPNISLHWAFEVWGIYKTNTFTDGVYLRMSRFNHSCQPNAEIFANQDANDATDVRALRNIKEGEEITICYTDSDKSLWSREERRAELKHVYNFDCNCEGCTMRDEQIQEENENIAAFREQVAKRESVEEKRKWADEDNQELRLNLIREEIDCVKQMYKLAKTIKPMNRGWILDNIVVRGFNLSCSGALGEEAKKFADVGLQIAKTLFGKDNLWTQLWKKRAADPTSYLQER